jgi:putative ATPase
MALIIANAAYQAVEKLGMPEARIPLAQATVYIAKAPKSNNAYKALDQIMLDIESGQNYPVPMHLRDSHYKDAKKYGYGQGCIYTHNSPQEEQQFMPEELKDTKYLI